MYRQLRFVNAKVEFQFRKDVEKFADRRHKVGAMGKFQITGAHDRSGAT